MKVNVWFLIIEYIFIDLYYKAYTHFTNCYSHHHYNNYHHHHSYFTTFSFRIMVVGLRVTRPPAKLARYKMIKHVKRTPSDAMKR